MDGLSTNDSNEPRKRNTTKIDENHGPNHRRNVPNTHTIKKKAKTEENSRREVLVFVVCCTRRIVGPSSSDSVPIVITSVLR